MVQWLQKTVDRKGSKNLTYHVKITSKEAIKCNVKELVEELNNRTEVYLKHAFNTNHQYKFLENLKKNLKTDEVFVVVDFSENYVCKYASEIQSVHFGASKKQISIHTGAFFYKDVTTSTIKCISFSTVSECLRHDAAAIWAHMQPVLNLVKSYVPNVKNINFQSDGPTTQYKNKSNFFLFQHHCKTLEIQYATWNFTTAGHGKSVADGIGGTVTQGKDIISAQNVVDIIKQKSVVNISLINEENFKIFDELLNNDIQPAPNSMKIHQIIWTNDHSSQLYINYLSCIKCITTPPCEHYGLSPNKYTPNAVTKKKDREKINGFYI